LLTHREIKEREVVESYLRGKLSRAESEAFEDHYFDCEECFAEVRVAGKFIAGVRHAAETGLVPQTRQWLPSFGFAWAAAAVLIVTTSWLAFFEIPKGRRELERQRAMLEAEHSRSRQLEKQLAMVRPPGAEGNVPLAMLEVNRAGQANELTVPVGASHLILWIELPPDSRFSSYRLQVLDRAGKPVETVGGLTRNPHGALTASVPAASLPAASYTVLLHGTGAGSDILVGEYRLVVR
jgi:hypothetical protein